MTNSYLVATHVYLLRIGDQLYDEHAQYMGRVNQVFSFGKNGKPVYVAGKEGQLRIVLDSGSVLDLPARYEVAIVETA